MAKTRIGANQILYDTNSLVAVSASREITLGTTISGADRTFQGDVIIDTGYHLTCSSDVLIQGDLNVEGVVNTITNHETELHIQDKIVFIASGSADSSAADGGGLKIDGADVNFLWSNSNSAMELNQHFYPETDDSYDLGKDGLEWKDLYLDGVAYVKEVQSDAGSLVLDAAASSVDVQVGGTQVLAISASALIPHQHNAVDLGAKASAFKDAWIAGDIHLSGVIDLGDATGDVIRATGRFESNITPSADSTYDLGSDSLAWSVVYADRVDSALDQELILAADADLRLSASTGQAVEIWIGGTEEVRVTDGLLSAVTHNDVDLGTDAVRFKQLWLEGAADLDSTLNVEGAVTLQSTLAVTGALDVVGVAKFNGNVELGDAASDTVNFVADVASNILPSANNTYDLGSSSDKWKDLHLAGDMNVANITLTGDLKVSGNVDLGDSSADGVRILGSLESDIVPVSDSAYDLGSNTLAFANVFADRVDSALDQELILAADADLVLSASTGQAIEMWVGGTEQVRVTDGVLAAVTHNDVDLGSDAVRFKQLWLEGAADLDSTLNVEGAVTLQSTLAVTGALDVVGVAKFNGNVELGDAASDTVNFVADVASDILPSAAATYDLGAASSEWMDAHFHGVVSASNISAVGAEDLVLLAPTGNLIEFHIGPNQLLEINSGSLSPTTDDGMDLGAVGKEFHDAFFDGAIIADEIRLQGNTKAISFDGDGDTYIEGDNDDMLQWYFGGVNTLNMDPNTNAAIYPGADSTYDLGRSNIAWRMIYTDQISLSSSAKGIIFDSDNDTYMESTSDDSLNMAAGGVVGVNLNATRLAVNIDVDLGDGTDDTISANGRFDTDLVPSTDSARALGSDSLRWSTAYLDAVDFNGGATALIFDADGDTYMQASSDDILQFVVGGVEALSLSASVLAAPNDNVVDIGAANNAFKDLWLSGAVYVNGVQATDDTQPVAIGGGSNGVSISAGGVQHVLVLSNAVSPGGPDAFDFGTSGAEWKDGWFDGVLYSSEVESLSSEQLTLDAASTQINFQVAGATEMIMDANALYSNTDADLDLGTSSKYFDNAYLDGVAYVSDVASANSDEELILRSERDLILSASTGQDIRFEIGGVEILAVSASALIPDGVLDLGDGTSNFNDAYFNGNLTVKGVTTLGDATSDTVGFAARVSTDIDPNADQSLDLGNFDLAWNQVYANIFAGPDDANVALSASSGKSIDFVIAGTTEVQIADGAIKPKTDNDVDLGTAALAFKDAYITGSVYLDAPDFYALYFNREQFTGDGSTNTFVLSDFSGEVVQTSAMVFVNGMLQTSGSGNDYTHGSGSSIEFITAPESSDNIIVQYMRTTTTF